MLLATTKDSNDFDVNTVCEYGIPGIILLEDAGFSIFKASTNIDYTKKEFTNYVVICGKGKNGGDGYVTARLLHSMGKNVLIVLLTKPSDICDDANVAFQMAKLSGVDFEIGFTKKAKKFIDNADCIIDCIFGMGFKNEPRDIFKKAIKIINNSNSFVVSADVPSGIDATTGQIFGECVKADLTVTFGLNKVGMVLFPASSFTGKVIVEMLSFSKKAIDDLKIKTNSLEIFKLPEISDGDYKNKRGETFIIAGSSKYVGAPFLASYSALKSGSGMVHLLIPDEIYPSISQKITEIIINKYPSINGAFSKKAVDKILSDTKNAHCIVLGCGLSVTTDTAYIVNEVLKKSKVPVVLDADGINLCDKEILKARKYETVITPHIGEMSKFLNIPSEKVIENRIEIAQNVANEFNITVVLKSANTIVSYPDKTVYINTFSNGGMATAGSGDVLSGIIGSFISQGMEVTDASKNAVAFHSAAGKTASIKKGKHFMSALDIIESFSNTEVLKNEQSI